MPINVHINEYPIYSFNISGPNGNKQILISAPYGDFLNDADMDQLMADFKATLLAREDVTEAPAQKFAETSQTF
ncbi:hypothetical protein [Streptomyces sp. NBC_01373]|uniref:hypothetical protein n=1 Tax=Streptomyces sp. NBC_01373 TaxID=2903843 RepID=UPI0022566968|nr:hypothetical protein [Streptomyces sp. NBC_01373]MCX4704368.1 hypothetical protein [Streptomyces sp. NBC_01373]MCX4707108.1 hypothetical protein [Streptomyces sp. NBC_01373]